MLDWLQDAFAEKDGRASSSRPVLWALAGWTIFGQAFAYYIIGYEYFVYHKMFGTDVILVLMFGGSAASGGIGAVIYGFNQYGNRDTTSTYEGLPDKSTTVAGENSTIVQTSEPLNGGAKAVDIDEPPTPKGEE